MESKMRIIVCFCIQSRLEDSKISYTVSKTFHCQCQPNRHGFFFIVSCDEHILFKRVFGGGSFVFNCQYFKLGLFEYRQNCCQIRYIMSFIADKICVEKVPETTERQIVKTENYLKSIKNETFFIFCSKETNIYLRLDNHDFKETSTFRKFGNDLILVQCIKF